MSSTVSSAAWLQTIPTSTEPAAAVHPAPVVPPAAPARPGRHRAPEVPDAVEMLTSAQIAAARPGRHAATR